jgi:uncharacterized protein
VSGDTGDKGDKGSKGDTGSGKPVRLRPKSPCPICTKPSLQRYHPFCSRRCADIDLNRWLSGRYAIPVADPSEDEDADGDADGAGFPVIKPGSSRRD